nr:hypothetical protein [Sporomusa silvacetica]
MVNALAVFAAVPAVFATVVATVPAVLAALTTAPAVDVTAPVTALPSERNRDRDFILKITSAGVISF